jgi:D-alanyl-D-alanine carboxypeptidase (penicillin-binding protein 5/6)
MRPGRLLIALAAGLALALTPLLAATPAVAQQQLLQPQADIVVDAGNGRVLIGTNIHAHIHPASTAKIMTALVGVERLAPNAMVTPNAEAANVELHRIGLTAGKAWPLNDILASLMMVSANDAAYAIADTVGHGSLDRFAADLNETAVRYGMHDSTFGDPAGLDDASSYRGGPYTSAYDLAVATRNALAVPAIAKWAAMYQYQFDDISGVHHYLTNHNRMLQPGGPYAFPGAIGFKTGYTNQAQHSIVAAATRNGRTLIAVVLGAPDAGYTEAANLLDAGFAMPLNVTGLGLTVPPVRVSLYANRVADRAGFAALGHALPANTPAAALGPTVPASIPVGAIAPRSAAPIGTSAEASATKSGLFTLRKMLLALFLVLVGAFLWRRRAVKRQRARRLAQRRQRVAAMRSGGLTVIDGRYRIGTRTGQPVESNIRVHSRR